MNPQTREQVRLSLLRYLDAAAGRRNGLAESVLRQFLISEGFTLTNEELAAELEYLRGKGLAAPAEKQISPENRAWVITAEGRDHYAQFC